MAGKRYYLDGDPDSGVTPSQLKRMGRERQREYVLSWFYRNFEDPAEETPHDSREGGYQYIWGGPYDAREELWSEFEGILSEERIEEIAERVERRAIEWAPGRDHPNHSSNQPDLDAEDVEDEGSGEPDFDAIVRALEAGAQPSYGGEVERGLRQELTRSVEELKDELARLEPDYGGIGHNRPPVDEVTAAAGEMLEPMKAAVETIADEASKEAPDAVAVAEAAGRLQLIGQWLLGKGETIAEGFAGAFGKSLGAASGLAAVAGATGLIGPIRQVIQAAAHWLHFVVFGF